MLISFDFWNSRLLSYIEDNNSELYLKMQLWLYDLMIEIPLSWNECLLPSTILTMH